MEVTESKQVQLGRKKIITRDNVDYVFKMFWSILVCVYEYSSFSLYNINNHIQGCPLQQQNIRM